MTAAQVYQQAMDQADEDLVNLSRFNRARVYIGGAQACQLWVARRAAWLLAQQLVGNQEPEAQHG